MIERALIKELTARDLNICSQVKIDIIYNNEKIGKYIPDIVIDDKIICELKSKPFLTKEDEKQFWGYLKGSKYKLGFLINFGPNKLTIKRFIYTK
ncbi:GxxExxY protein [bacterium]|nr:MAG: GxxExxY protein [bacterium]